MENRKKDHIDLAFKSRISKSIKDDRFYYEPILGKHPDKLNPITFLGKQLNAPIWISSMTGGTHKAEYINKNLAKACNEFGMGMGLGSCRIILDDDTYFHHFNLRNIIGDNLPFYANLGIAQIDYLVKENKTTKITDLIDRLRADGLIIHVNPMQEWFQPEGDKINTSPIIAIEKLLEKTNLNLIVKEVGQGMGPESLNLLMKMPLQAIEFGAFGGTNFAKVEMMRDQEELRNEVLEPLSFIGHDAEEMCDMVNFICSTDKEIAVKEIIVSGGISTFLDGYYLINKCKLNAIYGQASSMLKYAVDGYEKLRRYIDHQIQGLQLAEAYLKIKE